MLCDLRNIHFLLLCLLAAPLLGSVLALRVDGSQRNPQDVDESMLTNDAELLELAEGCEYADEVGFQVGDKVRIYMPGAIDHNAVSEVVCPRDGPGTEGRVCLNREGCWLPGSLRVMNPLELTLHSFRSRAKDVALACRKRYVWNLKWPKVRQKLVAFAATTRDKVTELSGKVLAAVNICDPEVRAQVQRSYSGIVSHINALADAGAERLPAARQVLSEIAAATKIKMLALGEAVFDTANSVAESEAVGEMIHKVVTRLDEFKSAALDKSPRLGDILSAINEFCSKVGELSSKVMALPKDAFEREQTQVFLSSIQSGAGKLLSAAAAKWRPVRTALRRFALASAAKIAELSGRAFRAVHPCNPEIWKQVRHRSAAVQSRVAQLATAVAMRARVTKESLQEVASCMGAKIAVLSEQVSTSIENENLMVVLQAKIATVKGLVAQLKELVFQKSAVMMGKAAEFAELIQVKVADLMRQVTHGETSTLDDEQDIAEM